MNKIEQRFLDEAAAELRAEEERIFMTRVTQRARILQDVAHREETSDLRSPLERLAELNARHAALLAEKRRAYPGCISASEDDELTRLPGRISELTKAARMMGMLPRNA